MSHRFPKFALLKSFMHRNTLKTTWGFLLTLLRNRTPFKFERKSIDRIYNYLPIDETLCTSGQPTETQFKLIKDAGFNTVINLAPANTENSLSDECGTLQQLDIDYIHIPVDFKKPTEADFEKFVAVLANSRNKKMWVHCAANMRVSAFIYRYRCEILREEPTIAGRDLAKIWTPVGVWKKFVSSAKANAPDTKC